MVLSLYGQTFTNEEEIVIALKERELSTGKIAMRSGNTLLRTGGSITIGRNYNVTVEGSSALSPFKGLSARLGALKGDSEFVVGITGPWDKPEINGYCPAYWSVKLDLSALGGSSNYTVPDPVWITYGTPYVLAPIEVGADQVLACGPQSQCDLTLVPEGPIACEERPWGNPRAECSHFGNYVPGTG